MKTEHSESMSLRRVDGFSKPFLFLKFVLFQRLLYSLLFKSSLLLFRLRFFLFFDAYCRQKQKLVIEKLLYGERILRVVLEIPITIKSDSYQVANVALAVDVRA